MHNFCLHFTSLCLQRCKSKP